jgi:hypothetical protein
MTQHTPSSRAGGCLIAGAILLGAGIGVALRQPSIGILAGAGVGIALALLLWLRERRR